MLMRLVGPLVHHAEVEVLTGIRTEFMIYRRPSCASSQLYCCAHELPSEVPIRPEVVKIFYKVPMGTSSGGLLGIFTSIPSPPSTQIIGP